MFETLERGSLQVDLLRFKYKNSLTDIFNTLNFKIEKGEFVGLMGRTGAGKTTAMMLLNGLIPHFLEGEFEGNVIANTMNTQRYHIQTMARFIGLVMQDPETQIFGITVERDVAFGPSNLAFGKEKIKEVVSKSLKAVGLEGYEKRITSELSGGEKQRLAIAGVLAMEPEILVLDEPTSELDPVGREEIYKLLSVLKKKGEVTILVSGHDTEEMLEYADRIIVLDNGRKVWEGRPSTLFKDIVLTKKNGIRPPEVSEIGNCFQKQGLLDQDSVFINKNEFLQFAKNNFTSFKISNNGSEKYYSTNNNPVAIETKDLSFYYQQKNSVLNELNIKIYKGEFVALIGKNGAGKTTFSKQLNGLLRPTNGAVFINGNDISQLTTAQLSKEVGYIFQNPDHQIFSATVYDEVEYGLKRMNLTETERSVRINTALEFVGLEKFTNRHPFTLGKGERQKLAFATVLAMEPKILIIDEPTTGQDWDGTNKMMEMLDKLHRQGHTILMITHNMLLAAEYTDRVIVFSNGKVMLDDPPEKVFYESEILKAASITAPDCVTIAGELRSAGYKNYPVTINELQNDLLEQLARKENVNRVLPFGKLRS
ncbi:MAG: ABC transporter ATP-binding protein [Melioribacteraceae bacterium]